MELLESGLVADHPCPFHPDDDDDDDVLGSFVFYVLRVSLIENGGGRHGRPNSRYTQRGRC